MRIVRALSFAPCGAHYPECACGTILALIATLSIGMRVIRTPAGHALEVPGIASTALTSTWVGLMSGLGNRLRGQA